MSSPAIHSHSYGLPTSSPPSSSVNATGKEEEGKERVHSHHSQDNKQVGKGGKKRSRAGKNVKAEPITILATDPSYFRAMVQQLTGISSSSYSTATDTNTNMSSSLYGMDSYSSFNPPGGEYTTQVLPTTLHSSTSFHVPNNNNNSLVSNPFLINPNPNPPPLSPLQYAHQDYNSNNYGGFTPDYLDQLRLMLLLGNSSDPFPTTTSTSPATTYSSIAPSSPSLHYHSNNNNNNNNNHESLWCHPSLPSLSPHTSPQDYPH